jgi:hypothetical protein
MICTLVPNTWTVEVPNEATLLAAGNTVIDSINDWKKGKVYRDGTVQTAWRAKSDGDGANWHSRVSEHGSDDGTFDEFWERLGGLRKAEYEKE